jgi:hypothetical protein
MQEDTPILRWVISSRSISNSSCSYKIIINQIIATINFNYAKMKIKIIVSTLFLLIMLSGFKANAQKDDLSGEWKLNREKSVLADNQLFLSRITIQQKADSLITTRVYENGNGEEYPFDEKISLDGKDCKIVIFEMPRTSKASVSTSDKSINIVSATTFNGNSGPEDMNADEIWKLDPDGQTLVLQFTNKMSGNETKGTYYFNKVK